MPHPFDRAVPSPDRQHSAHFGYGGDIRYGPSYFALAVDGHAFGQRIFGDVCLWSPDSPLFAVQEWLTLDYAEGPITALVMIDLNLGREVLVERVVKAFVVPLAFEGARIVYRKDYAGQAGSERFAVDITPSMAWKQLA